MSAFLWRNLNPLSDEHFDKISLELEILFEQSIEKVKLNQTYIRGEDPDHEKPFMFWRQRYNKSPIPQDQIQNIRMMMLSLKNNETEFKKFFTQWNQIMILLVPETDDEEMSLEAAYCLNKMYRGAKRFDEYKELIQYIPNGEPYYNEVFERLLDSQTKVTEWTPLFLLSNTQHTNEAVRERLTLQRYNGVSYAKIWDELKFIIASAKKKLQKHKRDAQIQADMVERIDKMVMLKTYLIKCLQSLNLEELFTFNPKISMDNELEELLNETIIDAARYSSLEDFTLVICYQKNCSKGWKNLLLEPIYENIIARNMSQEKLESLLILMKDKAYLETLYKKLNYHFKNRNNLILRIFSMIFQLFRPNSLK
ncbi:MAG: hypothetical protein COB02_12780 [Candidatus Cloacimonadota bacterium]|nr:MAG: hypothetical protein COB02_12780 [Candidatus Cloacimonadota bacterium]